MLTACFDASGHESDQRFLTVAGFISSTEDWAEFSARWTDRLKRDAIECFHAVECEHNHGEFYGWKNKQEEKSRLKEDLLDIIQSCTHRLFASTVEIAALNKELSSETRAKYNLRAYALGGRTCAARVREWSISWACKYVPSLIFEDGDLGKEELEIRLIEDGFARPIFLPKRDRQGKDGQFVPGHVPLQAADLFAYEMFRSVKSGTDDRWEFRNLCQKPGSMGIYTIGDMRGLESTLKLRTEELKETERAIKVQRSS
jgi:hypothetical protein